MQNTFITTIYSKLSSRQKKKVNNFLQNNFEEKMQNSNFELEPLTIITLAISENKIIGCICLYDNKFLVDKLTKNNIPLNYYTINNSHGCFIYNLCVHKEHRGKKIGYNLLSHAIQKMTDLNIDYLHTQAENDISQILFLKNGFIEDSVFKKLNIGNKVSVMSNFL
jgi:ribosomal protein S18 acetylase RimI-like enzyme